MLQTKLTDDIRRYRKIQINTKCLRELTKRTKGMEAPGKAKQRI